MNINLTMKKIYKIIIFQKKIKYIINKKKKFNNQLEGLINILMNILNNLSVSNHLKIINNSDLIYIRIIEFLKNIKENIYAIPYPLKFVHLYDKSLSQWQYELFKIRENIIQILYYISPNNLLIIFKFFYNDVWKQILNSDELEQYYTSLNYGECVSIPDIKNPLMQNETDYCTKFGDTYYQKFSNYVKCNNNDEYRVQCFNNLRRVRVSPPVQDVQEDFTINLRKNKIVSIILLICLLVFVQVCMSS